MPALLMATRRSSILDGHTFNKIRVTPLLDPTRAGSTIRASVKNYLSRFVLLLSFLLSPLCAQAALLHESGGLLIGASGVSVSGTLYDVTFIDGTCADIFSGCDGLDDFDFITEDLATAAANALLDQVFIGGFDTDPSKTFGCPLGGSLGDVNVCTAMTPFSIPWPGRVFYIGAVNNSLLLLDDVEQIGTGPTANTAGTGLGPYYVWARWTPATTGQAPVPGTILLLGIGIASLRWSRVAKVLKN